MFFAWQLDTPSDLNKKFIWDALQEATGSKDDYQIEEAPRPEMDTGGVSGSPNIVDTIFKRIASCAFFVADLTFVSEGGGGKKSPNPNVLIELGYAAKSIGWERTILVINSRYGGAQDLPFDIVQHRWPIEYQLSERTQAREKRFDGLAVALKAAISSCRSSILERAEEMAGSLDTAMLAVIAAYENSDFIDMRLPARTMGELLSGLDHILAVRQLISIGALEVTHLPMVGYRWTYDGVCMVESLRKKQPQLLQSLRMHLTTPPSKRS